MILRVCYDTEGKGMEREPQRIFVVQRHMQALGSLAERYADAILTVQGVFVGSWGEMHTSRFCARIRSACWRRPGRRRRTMR